MTGVTIVIPAHNEEAGLAAVLRDLAPLAGRLGVPIELVVVDDGSTDRTAEVARAGGADVLRHPVNLGYGAALKRGVRAARHEWVAILDADGTYPIEDLERLLREAEAYDMLVGARQGDVYRGGVGKGALRVIFRWLCAYVTGVRVPDPNSGCRVFRTALARRYLDTLSKGYSFTTSITMVFLLEGYAVGFLPIRYLPRIGQSKVRLWRDSVRSAQILLEIILLYNPLKAFLVFGLIPLGIGLACRDRADWLLPLLGGFSMLIWSLGGLAVLLSRRAR
jgi:glycosyltransferase involved in cell wall biosynthesis